MFADTTGRIENVPEKREYWVNVYRDGCLVRVSHVTASEAEAYKQRDFYNLECLRPPLKIYEEEVQT